MCYLRGRGLCCWHDGLHLIPGRWTSLYALNRGSCPVTIGSRFGHELPIELLCLLFFQINKVLSLFLCTFMQVLFPFHNMSPVVDVVSNSHLLNTRPGVLDRFLCLHHAIRSVLCAAGCLVDLRSPIRSRTHRHVTGAGEGSTTCWACHHVLHNWKGEERWLMSDVVGDIKN